MIGTGQPLTHPSFAQVDLREDPQEIMELFSQNRTVKSYVCLVSQTAHVWLNKLILMVQHPGYWFPSIHVIGDAEMMGHPNMGIFMMAI